jgi:hypothetical protein
MQSSAALITCVDTIMSRLSAGQKDDVAPDNVPLPHMACRMPKLLLRLMHAWGWAYKSFTAYTTWVTGLTCGRTGG